jgi:ABC-type amino acid transport substrate-binding protein
MALPAYKVVWPLGKQNFKALSLKPRVSDLKGKTICELSNYSFKADEIFPLIREIMSKRYPGVKFVEYNNFGEIYGNKERENVAALPDLLRKHHCDIVISGVGG